MQSPMQPKHTASSALLQLPLRGTVVSSPKTIQFKTRVITTDSTKHQEEAWTCKSQQWPLQKDHSQDAKDHSTAIPWPKASWQILDGQNRDPFLQWYDLHIHLQEKDTSSANSEATISNWLDHSKYSWQAKMPAEYQAYNSLWPLCISFHASLGKAGDNQTCYPYIS